MCEKSIFGLKQKLNILFHFKILTILILKVEK
jgi:hypothetical protein